MVVAVGMLVDRRYQVGELLGRGGMADVFRATDVVTKRPVALKLLRDGDFGSVERFQSEMRVLGRLDHPGVVGLQGAGRHRGVPYLVLDLVDGPGLANLLVRPLSVDHSLEVCAEVAEALAQAHLRGIVHRDVKPGNVLLDVGGHAHLTDFGIARLADSRRITATGAVVGSAAYVAPEQLDGQLVGPPADVYALGLVLLECLCGRPAYSGTRAEAALARLHRSPVIPAGLPAWLDRLLGFMTARDPRRRPSMDAVAEALRCRSIDHLLSATGPMRAATATDTTQDQPQLRRSSNLRPRTIPYRAALSAALLIGSLALGWIAGSHDARPTDTPTQRANRASPSTAPAPVPMPPSTIVNTPPQSEVPVADGQGRPEGPDHGDDENSGKQGHGHGDSDGQDHQRHDDKRDDD